MKVINIRITEEQEKELKEKTEALGLTKRSEYIRIKLFTEE